MKDVEQHEQGFNKAVRQAGFFIKELNLGLSETFKGTEDDVLLDEEDIVAEEEVVEEQGGDATVQVAFVYFLLFFVVGFWPHRPCTYDNLFFFF